MSPSKADAVFRLDRECLLFTAQRDSEPALTSQGVFTIYNVTSKDGHMCKAQVGDVFWTLESKTYCVRVNKTTFSFSVTNAPDIFVTVVLPSDTSDKELDQLLAVVSATTQYHEADGATRASEAHHPDSMEAKAAQIGKVAGWAVLGCATAASYGLKLGAEIVKKTLPQGPQVEVSEKTMNRLEGAKKAAGHVADLTGKVATVVASATCSVASRAASSLSHSGLSNELAKSGVDVPALSRAAAAGLAAMREILLALEKAGQQVLKVLAEVATDVVGHRYGPQAAAATATGMEAAIHVTEARTNLLVLKPTNLIKKTAKQTASELMAQKAAQAAAVEAAAATGASGTGAAGALLVSGGSGSTSNHGSVTTAAAQAAVMPAAATVETTTTTTTTSADGPGTPKASHNPLNAIKDWVKGMARPASATTAAQPAVPADQPHHNEHEALDNIALNQVGVSTSSLSSPGAAHVIVSPSAPPASFIAAPASAPPAPPTGTQPVGEAPVYPRHPNKLYPEVPKV